MTELLHTEAAAITECARRLRPESVEAACHMLASCRGKVVLVGVGKSGIVARKIAATLNSTGTVAVTLHPSDALHGDIGIISNQ
ncbi:MAG TPA: SIS domain-containing protein, partial [Tepidisphaeraceae bacterium]|nr:SIS domain-containing protein [Tepidisphaeraceae bacterium]